MTVIRDDYILRLSLDGHEIKQVTLVNRQQLHTRVFCQHSFVSLPPCFRLKNSELADSRPASRSQPDSALGSPTIFRTTTSTTTMVRVIPLTTNTHMLPDTPEELLREIFRNLLHVPVDAYFSQTDRFYTEFPVYESNLTSLLLVCKKWLRIATPLLYESIGIGTEAQMGRLAYTLRSNPTLGLIIRNLRLDGGFGKHLYTVAKCAPHIQTLSVRVHPDDRGANVGYLHALPCMKPTMLYVHGLLCDGHSKKQRIMVEATFLAIRAWLPLVSCFVLYSTHGIVLTRYQRIRKGWSSLVMLAALALKLFFPSYCRL